MPTNELDDLQPEYRFDYRQARRNRFAKPVKQGSLMVVLDPDVAQVFTSEQSVNAILRALIQAMPHITKPEAETIR